MGRTKIAVRAQRKFAHKANYPFLNKTIAECNNTTPSASAPSASALPTLAPPANLAEPLQTPRTNQPVKDLLDQVSFRNIHEHQKKKPPLRDVRVVLKRLSPQRELPTIAIQDDPPDIAIQDVTPNIAIQDIPPNIAIQDIPPNIAIQDVPQVPNAAKPTQNGQHAGVIKPPTTIQSKRAAESIAESEIIKSLKRMNLRTRTISRDWIVSDVVRKRIRGKRAANQPLRPVTRSSSNVGNVLESENPIRRASETSTEDNKPLAYFANNSKGNCNKRISNSHVDNTSQLRIRCLRQLRHSRPVSYVTQVTRKRTRKIGVEKNKKTLVPKIRKKTTAAKRCRRAALSKNIEENVTTFTPQALPLTNVPLPKMRGTRLSIADSHCEYWRDTPNNDIDPCTAVATGNFITLNNEEQSASSIAIINNNSSTMNTEKTCIQISTNGAQPNIASNIVSDREERHTYVLKRTSDSPNPLADFIINIFNWVDDADTDGIASTSLRNQTNDINSRTGEEDVSIRVLKWLSNINKGSHRGQSVAQSVFKVPETPQRIESNRLSLRRASLASSSNASAVPMVLSLKEHKLRKQCISWNYKTLCAVVTKPALIRRFCGECTRCIVMFKSDNMLNATEPSKDVYDFIIDRDDLSRNISAYRANHVFHSEKTLFKDISKDNDYRQKLKNIMTNTGKKILQSAIIINQKINTTPLLPKEKIVLAEVIGILAKCNKGDIITNRNPSQCSQATAPQSLDALNQPGPSGSRLRDDDVDSLQREHLQNSGQEIPSTKDGTLKESLKLNITINEFSKCPVTFVNKVLGQYPGTGICGIKPPSNFKPACVIKNTQLNFKSSNQYLQRMLTRWGPASRESCAIRSLLDFKMQRSPVFEGLEVDLVKLFNVVQDEGGIEACQNDQQKWQIVAKKMKIYNSKTTTKLENIYLKYLLTYNFMSSEEREKLKLTADACWRNREAKAIERAKQPLWRQKRMLIGKALTESDMAPMEKACSEVEECVTPGRYCNYDSFNKLSQQVMGAYFPDNPNPTPEQVELVYWDIVMSAADHVCVHAASVDAAEHGAGFTDDHSDKYSNHPWNLKNLRENPNNLLRYLGPSIGVSSPSLQFGMVFSTSCWHMDPTSVPWIEYLHTGSPKIWYSVSADQSKKMRAAADDLCPSAVQNKDIWLPCDIIMIPPMMLRQFGVNVERLVQYPGEFVVVYPNTYCACIDTGFSISEGVYFAPHNWINSIENIFLTLRMSCEPSLFSMEKLLISMVEDERTPYVLLQRVNTVLVSLLRAELSYRHRMVSRGIELMLPEVFLEQNQRASRVSWQIQNTAECAYCRCHLHLSRVIGVTEGQTSVCAMHGLYLFEHTISRQVQVTNVFCIVLLSNDEINAILEKLKKLTTGRAVV